MYVTDSHQTLDPSEYWITDSPQILSSCLGDSDNEISAGSNGQVEFSGMSGTSINNNIGHGVINGSEEERPKYIQTEFDENGKSEWNREGEDNHSNNRWKDSSEEHVNKDTNGSTESTNTNSLIFKDSNGLCSRNIKNGTENPLFISSDTGTEQNKRSQPKWAPYFIVETISDTKKKYTCIICWKFYDRVSHLNRHVMSHTGNYPIRCDVCNMGFSDQSKLTIHYRTHTNEKPYQCSLCGKSFKRTHDVRLHMKRHDGTIDLLKTHKCDVCNKAFLKSSMLLRHKKHHEIRNPESEYMPELFPCEVCNAVLRSKEGFRKHQMIHTGDQPYTCDICGKSFLYKSGYIAHMDFHNNIRRHVCEICGRAFRRWNQLYSHKLIHADIRKYMCEFCGKSFLEKGHYRRHRLIHTGDKPFSCNVCGKNFNQRGNCRVHLRTHKAFTVVKCDICTVDFAILKADVKNDPKVSHTKCPTCTQLQDSEMSDFVFHHTTNSHDSSVYSSLSVQGETIQKEGNLNLSREDNAEV